MTRTRATDAEKAYWRRLGAANARLDPAPAPCRSIDEVFARMAEIRAQLGEFATPGCASDPREEDERALAELRRVRALWLRKSHAGA